MLKSFSRSRAFSKGHLPNCSALYSTSVAFTNPLKVFSPPRNPKLKMALSAITPDEAPSMVMRMAKIFTEGEALHRILGMPAEALCQDLFYPICLGSLQDKLAFKVNNLETGEFVGQYWSLDRLTLNSISGIKLDDERIKEIYDFSSAMLENMKVIELPKKRYEQIYLYSVEVSDRYKGLDIGKIFTDFQIEEYELTKNAKIFFADTLNEFSKNMQIKAGLKSEFSLNYSELKGKPQYPRIQKVQEFLKSKGEKNTSISIDLMILRR